MGFLRLPMTIQARQGSTPVEVHLRIVRGQLDGSVVRRERIFGPIELAQEAGASHMSPGEVGFQSDGPIEGLQSFRFATHSRQGPRPVVVRFDVLGIELESAIHELKRFLAITPARINEPQPVVSPGVFGSQIHRSGVGCVRLAEELIAFLCQATLMASRQAMEGYSALVVDARVIRPAHECAVECKQGPFVARLFEQSQPFVEVTEVGDVTARTPVQEQEEHNDAARSGYTSPLHTMLLRCMGSDMCRISALALADVTAM